MKLSHIQDNRAKMVDISDKIDVVRRAVATGEIILKEQTMELIQTRQIEKGEVLETARIAAVLAIKQTSSVIPMCHNIPISSIDIQFQICGNMIRAIATVKSTGKTGVEMEALHGVSIALLTIWDMVKSAEKDETGNYPVTLINNVRVQEKSKKLKGE